MSDKSPSKHYARYLKNYLPDDEDSKEVRLDTPLPVFVPLFSEAPPNITSIDDPAKWVFENLAPEHPLREPFTKHAKEKGWNKTQMLAALLLLTDAAAAQQAGMLAHAASVIGSKLAEESKIKTYQPVGMTIRPRDSEADACPFHPEATVERGTVCTECFEEAIKGRPGGLTEERAREVLTQVVAEALEEGGALDQHIAAEAEAEAATETKH